MSPVVSAKLSPAEAERLAAYLESTGQTASEAMRGAMRTMYSGAAGEMRRQGREAAYAADPSPYRFDGTGPSLLADIRNRSHDQEAANRLERYGRAQRDGKAVTFATVTTSSAAEVVPPEFRPDVVVPPVATPLTGMARRVPIAAPTPFQIPGTLAVTGSAQQGTEGVSVGDATLSVEGSTITPTSVWGRIPLSRELLDGASPATDLIALAAARADYDAEVERQLFAVLNGAGGQGGVITGGKVPSGASVYEAATVTDAPGVTRELAARFVHRAGARPRGLAVSEEFAVAVDDLDMSRPHLRDLAITGSPAMTDAAAGDGDAIALAPDVAWVWATPRAEIRYGERQGPEIIELTLFGYVGMAVVRPAGVSAVRLA